MLSQKQIDTLFKFTANQGVEYYDLQVELVDHLASGIEEELAKDSSLAPYDALQKVFSGFGKNGFDKLVTEKKKALRKENTKVWLQLAKQYFTIPKIAFTAFLFAVLYWVSGLVDSTFKAYVVQAFLLLCLFGQSFFMLYLYRGRKVKLLLTAHTSVFQLTGFFIPYWTLYTVRHEIHNQLYFAIVITTYFILTVSAVQLNQQLREKALALYPEAFAKA